MKKLFFLALALICMYAFAVIPAVAAGDMEGQGNGVLNVTQTSLAAPSVTRLVNLADMADMIVPNFTVYMEAMQNGYIIGDTIFVDIMLAGNLNYTQASTVIAYDAGLLEFAGYQSLHGLVAEVKKEADNKVSLRSVPTMNMFVGASCSTPVKLVTLKFKVRNTFTSGSVNTNLTFASIAVTPVAGVSGTTTAPGAPLPLILHPTTDSGHGHEWMVKEIVEPTCEAEGYTLYKCSRCEEFKKEGFVPTLTHMEGEGVVATPATCENTGILSFSCAFCGQELRTATIAPLGHEWITKEVIKPTCENQGYTIYVCSRCGEFKNGSFLPALAHVEGEGVITTSATCKSAGILTFSCVFCGNGLRTETIAPLGHEWITKEVIAPTCAAQGYTIYGCSRCGEFKNGDFVPALGHYWQVKEIVPPTGTAQGYTIYKCSRCGAEKLDDFIEPLGMAKVTIIAGEGGSIITGASGDYTKGSMIGLKAQPLDGYIFLNWTSSAGGVFADALSAETTFTIPANDVIVTANFAKIEDGDIYYEVTFDLDYENAPPPPPIQLVKAGEMAVGPEPPTREGYIFTGWFSADEEYYDFATPVVEDMTLYTQWFEFNEDDAIVEYAYHMISVGHSDGDYDGSVTKKLSLPTSVEELEGVTGLSIVWSSSNTGVISNSGVVTRPAGANATVTLTATITRGGASLTKDFEFTVIRAKNIDYDQLPELSIEDIEAMNEGSDSWFEIQLSPDEEQVTSIAGKFSDIKVECLDDALAVIYGVRGLIGLASVDDLVLAVVNPSEIIVGYTFNQMYDGIEVYGRKLTIVVDANGVPVSLNSGLLRSDLLPDDTLNYSQAQAETTAKAFIGGELEVLYAAQIIYSLDEYEEAPTFAYGIYLAGINNDGDYIIAGIIVNAITEEIVSDYSQTYEIYDIDEKPAEEEHYSPGPSASHGMNASEIPIDPYIYTKITAYNEKGLPVYEVPVTYMYTGLHMYLIEDRERNIVIRNARPQLENLPEPIAVSAYENVRKTYNFYSTLGHYGIDGNHGKVNTYVHYNRRLIINSVSSPFYFAPFAVFNVSGLISEGIHLPDYNKHTKNLAINPDISWASNFGAIAHEYSHGVNHFIAGKGYETKFSDGPITTSIDEGYADTFAALITGRWIVLDDWTNELAHIRNMANPNASYNPTKLYGTYYEIDPKKGHTNSTIVSHVAYLINNKYGMSTNRLAKLYYESLIYGYGKTSDFDKVRSNVTKAANNLNYTPVEIENIEKAFDEVYKDAWSTLICNVIGADSRRNIADARLDIYEGSTISGNPIATITTNLSGVVLVDLSEGTYTLVITKDNYNKSIVNNVIITKNKITNKTISLRQGTSTINVKANPMGNWDSSSASPAPHMAADDGLAGVTMNFREGWNTKTGDIVESLTTDANGYCSFTGNSGKYTIEAVKNGYKTGYKNVTVVEGRVINYGVDMYGIGGGEITVLLYGNTPGNINNGGIAAIQGDRIYYCDGRFLYSINIDGTDRKMLHSNYASGNINVVGDRVYFTTREGICSIKTNDSDLQILSDDRAASMHVIDDQIYYRDGANYIYTMKTDGTDRRQLNDNRMPALGGINVVGDRIYHRRPVGYVGQDGIYSIKTDGSDLRFHVATSAYDFCVDGDRIYYGGAGLRSAKIDGSDDRLITDSYEGRYLGAGWINVTGEKIYFSTTSTLDRSLYVINKNGSSLQRLTDEDSYHVSIVGDRIFSDTFTMKIDGTELQNTSDFGVGNGDIFQVSGLNYRVLTTGATDTVAVVGATIYSVTTVRIPATVDYRGRTFSVTLIENEAFLENSSITILDLASALNLQFIGNSAFSGCRKLISSLTIPSSVTSIGSAAFSDCRNLTGSLTIPSSVTSIGRQAFSDCSGFTGSLTIPSSVTSIDYYAFGGCSGFTGSLTIPSSVTSIDRYAFYNCGFTGSLTIPSSVTSIDAYAFYYCDGITEFRFMGIAAPAMPYTIRYGTAPSYYPLAGEASYLAQPGLPKPAYSY